jgi:hypothetical protein
MGMGRLGWACALAVGLASGTARAEQGVLVLSLEHEGLPAAIVKVLDAAVRDEVKASLPQYALLPPPALDLNEMQLAAGCVDASPTCLSSIGRTLGAARVVRVTTQGTAQRLKVKVLVVRTQSRKATSYDGELVGVDAESGPELRWHVAKGLGRDPGPLSGGIELYTASKVGALEGAEVFLDDTRVTPAALAALAPGKHRVAVHQQGFETFIWLGQVRPGRATRVGVVFEPKRVAAATPPPPAPPPAAAPPPPPTVTRPPPVASAPPPGPPPAAAPPPPPATPPPGVVTPGPARGPRLLFTWVFAAGAVVAGSAGTIFAVQTQQAEREVNDAPLACYDETAVDWDHPTCQRGRSRELMQFVAWGATGAFAAAAVAAFFLEDGPELFSQTRDGGEGATVRVGVAPGPDGVAAGLRVDF